MAFIYTKIKYPLCLALAALVLALSGCGGEAPASDFSAPGALVSERPESGLTDSESFYMAERLKYMAPLGVLLNEESWDDPHSIDPDSLFEFYLQVSFGTYFTEVDYEAVYGDSCSQKIIPDDFAQEDDGSVIFPMAEVEALVRSYFDVDAEYLRTARCFDAGSGGYRLEVFDMREAVLPVIKKIEVKNGEKLFTLELYKVCDFVKLDKSKTEGIYLLAVEDRPEGFVYKKWTRYGETVSA
ncbi:MAG: hypothetical protein LBC56_07595 [Oscillospiraceae bacterium]|nr:hypothetical protein [Oscillospiraceae bacterium]